MKRLQAIVLVLLLAVQFAAGQGAPVADSELAQRARGALAQIEGRVELSGLRQPVEVLRDEWGVPHIYARTQDDLFFAQGYVAAQDRLWQMELWRRAGEGKLAEVLGPAAVGRDRVARLLRYRGDMRAEWAAYAPDARRIIAAFVRGVNAYIAASQDNLPIEFQLAGIRPEPWTPEVCLTRVAGLEVSGNAGREITRAQLVRLVGTRVADKLLPTDPYVPTVVPFDIDLTGIDNRVLGGLNTASEAVNFRAQNGSNNWVVDGTLTTTGKPLLANDPHRSMALPSLRYVAHLVAPGWDVIGAGEPALPGVAVGHNRRVGFGFTIVNIDQQDLYVEETNAAQPTEVRYRGRWEPMRVVREQIRVKGEAEPRAVELHFTRHGPVLYEDTQRHRAYALRSVMSEPGTAAYLAALSVDRATDWRTFRAALARWRAPAENFVYADVDGNIGWQATGLTPLRRGRDWHGLLPVPGSTGDSEWQGFLSPYALPHTFNPAQHFVATANHKIIPRGYQPELGHEFSPPMRFQRIDEVLRARTGWTVADFARLQHDTASLPARELVPLLRGLKVEDKELRAAIELLLGWDMNVTEDSAAAALYEMWLTKLPPALFKPRVKPEVWSLMATRFPLAVVIAKLKHPDYNDFGNDAQAARDEVLRQSLSEAVNDLRARFGTDMRRWRWGELHKTDFRHALATDDARRAVFNPAPVARGGDANTVMATGGANFRQTHGASFREILDVSDWDNSLAINVPGQSGQPESPHYSDLLPLWAAGRYFPLLYTRAAVERHTRHRLLLVPKRG